MQGLLPLYRYFEFSGRSSRAEYWQWILLTTVAGWLTGILDALQSSPYDPSHKFTGILALGTLIPNLAVGIRRLHDRGKTGWHYGAFLLLFAVALGLLFVGVALQARTGDNTVGAFGFIALAAWLIYTVYMVVQLAKPGDPFANAYGEPPNADAPTIDLGEKMRGLQASFAPTATFPPTIDPLEQIERLAKLRDAGTLTEEEFQQQKTAYLGRLGS